ncbi:MAG: extracellular solute-binding protein [Anaerolineae bacterium]
MSTRESFCLTRRALLRCGAAGAAAALLAACQPQTVEVEKVVKETVEVEKVVKETVEVEVEKVVKETVVVEAGPQWTDYSGKEMVFWGLQYDPHVEAYHRLARLYNELTGGTVKVEPQKGDFSVMLVTAIAAGMPPDVYFSPSNTMTALMLQKVLLNLDDVVFGQMDIDPKEAFVGDSLGCTFFEGHYYGVPCETGALAGECYIPVADLDALGLADKYPPTNGELGFESFEQLWECAEALMTKEDGRVIRWGLSADTFEHQAYLGALRSLMAPEGMKWWDPDTKQFNVDSELGVDAMELLYVKPVELGIQTYSADAAGENILKGQLAISYGSVDLDRILETGLEYDVCLAPPPDPSHPALYIGGAGWTFNTPVDAKNSEMAVEYLRMMCTTDGQREWARIYGGIASPWKGLAGKYDHCKYPDPNHPITHKLDLVTKYVLPNTEYIGEGANGYFSDINRIVDTYCKEVVEGLHTAAEGCGLIQGELEAQYAKFEEDFKEYWG